MANKLCYRALQVTAPIHYNFNMEFAREHAIPVLIGIALGVAVGYIAGYCQKSEETCTECEGVVYPSRET